jgi:hypothetical protein
MPGKRVQIDDETWHALDLLARYRRVKFQTLAEEAFIDVLRKHNRPIQLKSVSRQRGQKGSIHSSKLRTRRRPSSDRV